MPNFLQTTLGIWYGNKSGFYYLKIYCVPPPPGMVYRYLQIHVVSLFWACCCCCCCYVLFEDFTALSTLLWSSLSIDLFTLLQSRLTTPQRLTSAHILSPANENCPSGISGSRRRGLTPFWNQWSGRRGITPFWNQWKWEMTVEII